MATTITSDMEELLVQLVPHYILYAYRVYSLRKYYAYTYTLIYHKVFMLMPLPLLPAEVNTM